MNRVDVLVNFCQPKWRFPLLYARFGAPNHCATLACKVPHDIMHSLANLPFMVHASSYIHLSFRMSSIIRMFSLSNSFVTGQQLTVVSVDVLILSQSRRTAWVRHSSSDGDTSYHRSVSLADPSVQTVPYKTQWHCGPCLQRCVLELKHTDGSTGPAYLTSCCVVISFCQHQGGLDLTC